MLTSLSAQVVGLVEASIADRLTPGAVVLVARNERLLHHAAYGTTAYDDPISQPVTLDTIYDLASITKMLVATAALRLVDQGVLALDDPLERLLPDANARHVTLRQLLSHSSGLHIRLSTLRDAGRDGILQAVYDLVPSEPPGRRAVYSNVNALLVGLILERASGVALDQQLTQDVLMPLGMRETGFCPPHALRERIAPTEYDSGRGLVHGVVHDESAWALGGICGHAGLFGSALDLWRFAELWLAGGQLAEKLFLRPATVAAATQEVARGNEGGFGLGWMLDRPAWMGAAADRRYGHTGFTGSTLLIDPVERLVVVLLANRTFPQRHPIRTHALVAAIAACVGAL